MTTPVDVWAPAFDRADFKWLQEMPVEQVFEGPLGDYRRIGKYHCRLCEVMLLTDDLKAHARQHRSEYRAWKSDKEQKLRRDRAEQLKRVNQLKREVV